MAKKFQTFFTFLILQQSVYSQIHIRIATWNVGDNQHMSGSFMDAAIDKVLGLDLVNVPKEMPDVYVVGLQQECWLCNQHHLPMLAQRFNERINAEVNSPLRIFWVFPCRLH